MYWGQVLLQIDPETVNLFQTVGILLGVAISVIVIVLEIRRYKQGQGYSTYVQSVLSFAELERMMLQHEELMQIYWGKKLYSKAKTSDERAKEEHKIYHWYYQFFTIIEVVFYAEQKRLLDRGQWDGWLNTIDNYIELDSDHFVQAWIDSRRNYSKDFAENIDSLTPCLFCKEPISTHGRIDGSHSKLHCTVCTKECNYS